MERMGNIMPTLRNGVVTYYDQSGTYGHIVLDKDFCVGDKMVSFIGGDIEIGDAEGAKGEDVCSDGTLTADERWAPQPDSVFNVYFGTIWDEQP
jgi:hypothetical protein